MKLAILNCVDEYVDYNRPNIREQLENILDDDDNFHLDQFTTNEEMFEIIHKELGSPTVAVTACNIWESKDLIYAGYFIDSSEFDTDEKKSDKKINMLASQIVSHNVTGRLAIVKTKLSYEIKDNNVKCITEPDNLSTYDLLNILENIYVKNGISLTANGNMIDYKYIVNPLEQLILTDPTYEAHYRYHEYEIYNCVIKVILDINYNNDTSTNINASWICNRIIKGDVFIAMYRKPEFNENPPYISISQETFKNIVNLRKLSSTAGTNINKSDKEYINFEKLLEIELNRLNNLGTPIRHISTLNQEPLNNIK
jgi:hypothetical protein